MGVFIFEFSRVVYSGFDASALAASAQAGRQPVGREGLFMAPVVGQFAMLGHGGAGGVEGVQALRHAGAVTTVPEPP